MLKGALAQAKAKEASSQREHGGRNYVLPVSLRSGESGVKMGVKAIDPYGRGAAGGSDDDLRERIEDTHGDGPVNLPGEWRFRNCLRRPFDEEDACVSGIAFPISRHSEFEHQIYFQEPVSEAAAIGAAERFLSVDYDEEYYERIKRDLFFNPKVQATGECYSFAEITEMTSSSMRGSLLSDLKYVDCIYELRKAPTRGILYLGLGS